MATLATSAAGYLWQDPGDAILIQVTLDLVDRLGLAVQQGLGDGPRGTEIGGLLLGEFVPGRGRAVLIDDFEPVPSQHVRGPSYTLATKEQQQLGTLLKRRRNSEVVGFYRSHTRPGMYLDQDDFAVISRFFKDPSQVFLLVKPAVNGPAVGGFFFWEDGDINRRSPYRQFTFDPAWLGARPARLAPVPAPKPAAPKQRKAPPVSTLVIPTIAALFLIAAFFVSPHEETKAPAATARAVAPVEPLLPQPLSKVTEPTPVVAPSTPAPTLESAPAPLAAATPKASPAFKPVPTAPSPSPATTPRTTTRAIEPPPVVTASNRPERPLIAILPPVKAAPQPEATVSYEQHTGVFRRALRKITVEGYVPPSPTRKVAPSGSAGAGEVDVKVFIDESGNVSRAQVLTKGSEQTETALAAAREWQFRPARKHDKPVTSEMVLHFRF
ncbi:MAG TPA: TonB family protein [Bryobacteraceae bacterium]|nr:TonB family protein [Bryobacteraceae bacterium]